MANDHLAVEHPRRARDEPNIVLAHRHLRPERLAGLCVDRDQTPVLRTGVDLAVPPGDPAAAPALPQLAPRSLGRSRIIFPKLAARGGVERPHHAIARPGIENPSSEEHTSELQSLMRISY